MRVMTRSLGRVFRRAECVCDVHLQGIDLNAIQAGGGSRGSFVDAMTAEGGSGGGVGGGGGAYDVS